MHSRKGCPDSRVTISLLESQQGTNVQIAGSGFASTASGEGSGEGSRQPTAAFTGGGGFGDPPAGGFVQNPVYLVPLDYNYGYIPPWMGQLSVQLVPQLQTMNSQVASTFMPNYPPQYSYYSQPYFPSVCFPNNANHGVFPQHLPSYPGVFPQQLPSYPGVFPQQPPSYPGVFPQQPPSYPGVFPQQPPSYPGVFPQQLPSYPGVFPQQPPSYPGVFPQQRPPSLQYKHESRYTGSSLKKRVSFTMEKISKAEESGDSSSFSYLPDEIVLEILSRLIDLKTLCFCKLVSIRFNLIIHQVNAISFSCTRVDHPTLDSKYHSNSDSPGACLICECKPFWDVTMKSLQTFSGLKSLCIEIPPPPGVADNRFSFKWNIKFSNSINSFLFLSPNSICDMKKNVEDDEEEEEEDVELSEKKYLIACDCLTDALIRYQLLVRCIKCLPLLENVTITQPGKWGRLSLCGEKIVEVRGCRYLDPENIEQRLKSFDNMRKRLCYVPLLKLPITGYMMKGVYLVIFEMSDLLNDDSSMNMNLNDFEDKEEAAYSEAVMEIFKKHRGRIERL